MLDDGGVYRKAPRRKREWGLREVQAGVSPVIWGPASARPVRGAASTVPPGTAAPEALPLCLATQQHSFVI